MWHDWGIRCGRGGWFGTESLNDRHGARREEQVGGRERSLLLSILKAQKLDLWARSQGRGKHPRILEGHVNWASGGGHGNCELGHLHLVFDLAHEGESNLSGHVLDRS